MAKDDVFLPTCARMSSTDGQCWFYGPLVRSHKSLTKLLRMVLPKGVHRWGEIAVEKFALPVFHRGVRGIFRDRYGLETFGQFREFITVNSTPVSG